MKIMQPHRLASGCVRHIEIFLLINQIESCSCSGLAVVMAEAPSDIESLSVTGMSFCEFDPPSDN